MKDAKDENNKMNINSLFIMILTASVWVAGYCLAHIYSELADGQKELQKTQIELQKAVMPRAEIEIQLLDIRQKITALEIDVAKLKK